MIHPSVAQSYPAAKPLASLPRLSTETLLKGLGFTLGLLAGLWFAQPWAFALDETPSEPLTNGSLPLGNNLEPDLSIRSQSSLALPKDPSQTSLWPKPFQRLKDRVQTKLAPQLKNHLPNQASASDTVEIDAAAKGVVYLVVPSPSQQAFSDIGFLVAEDIASEWKAQGPQTRHLLPQALNQALLPATLQTFASHLRQTGRLTQADQHLLESAVEDAAFPLAHWDRLVCLSSQLDWSRPTQARTSVAQWKRWLADQLPQEGVVFLQSQIMVFDRNPGTGDLQLVWKTQEETAIPSDGFGGMMPSVTQNPMAAQQFQLASQRLSQQVLHRAPPQMLYHAKQGPPADASVWNKVKGQLQAPN
jgi:hypothetical protein